MEVISYTDGQRIQEKISPVEQDIISYINKGEDDKEILKRDSRWEVFYHLSPMRESLFNWLDLKPEAKLLELGCELGALTSLFSRKCAEVLAADWSEQKVQAVSKRHRQYGNLNVFAGNIQNYNAGNKYDYVVLMPAYYGAELKSVLGSIKNLVKEMGSIYIVVKNKIGIDVMAGKAADGGNPYDAWNHTESGYYSYMEVKDILREIGYKTFQFYYPVPDHILPQEIYAEENLPDDMHHDRILNYYPCTDTLLFHPGRYMEETMKNHIFRECANSFLVECSAQGALSSITYAALSTDRERKAAYATKIYRKEYVKKSALFEEGREGICRLYQNAEELRRRGISIVNQEKKDGGRTLVMPYIKHNTLQQHMKYNCRRKEDFQRIFDELYRLILRSSGPVDGAKNVMKRYDSQADWGVILEYAYIDMIPLNCFYIDKTFVFFDQEFRFGNYPAKYVLFRALRYTELACCHDGQEFDLEYFKKRYHLEQIWKACMEEEDRFIYQNRNHELYANFYRWTELDDKKIQENVERICNRYAGIK